LLCLLALHERGAADRQERIAEPHMPDLRRSDRTRALEGEGAAVGAGC